MKVILTESYMSLGEAGETIDVRPGYARNFLIPQKLAVSATLANVKKYEDKAKEMAAKRERERENSKKTLSLISDISITMKKKTSDEGKLFGSVTTKEIEEEFKKLNVIVDRRQIILGKQIKMIGDYTVLVKLVGGMSATIPLQILPETPLKSASAALTESLLADNERLDKRDAAIKERESKNAAATPATETTVSESEESAPNAEKPTKKKSKKETA